MAESLSPWSGHFLPNLCIKDYRLRQSPRLRTILLFLPRFRFQIFKPIYFSKWLFILGHSNSISNLNFSPKNGQNLKIFFNGNSYDKLQSPQSQKIYSIDFLNRCSGSFLRFKPSTVWKAEKKKRYNSNYRIYRCFHCLIIQTSSSNLCPLPNQQFIKNHFHRSWCMPLCLRRCWQLCH